MSSQLNPIIAANIADLRPQRPSINRHGLYRVLSSFPSQSYPPNVAAASVTTTLKFLSSPSIVVMDAADAIDAIAPVLIPDDTQQFEGGIYYRPLLQEPVLVKKHKIENPLARLSEAVISEIDALMVGREDEAKPTAFAYSNARNLIESAYGKAFGHVKVPWSVQEVLPNPAATTDDMGGIRLLWHEGTKEIRLNFGADENRRSYLYFEEDLRQQGNNHGVEALDSDHLAKRFAWLMGK
jgi:hypothetical protein